MQSVVVTDMYSNVLYLKAVWCHNIGIWHLSSAMPIWCSVSITLQIDNQTIMQAVYSQFFFKIQDIKVCSKYLCIEATAESYSLLD